MSKINPVSEAAERSFDRWWKARDRWGWPMQLVWPVAFRAGVRWALRQRRAEKPQILKRK